MVQHTIKVIIDDEEFSLTIQRTTQKVIESPSGKKVLSYDAALWKYLEE